MTMRLATLLLSLILPLLAAGCSEEQMSSATCDLAASITFDGREYLAAKSVPELGSRKVRIGALLGTGEVAACPGQKPRKVEVYRVRGVSEERAVFAEPMFGLMRRWNMDGSIQ